MPLEDYIIMGKLGQGTYGVVERVMHIQTNQLYALKAVSLNNLKPKCKANAYNQIDLLSQIAHPNIIGYKQSFLDQDNNILYTVLELASRGDLADRIKSKRQKFNYFKESQIWAIGRDIVNGLAALHQRNIIHRDIKPGNILFDADKVAKIGDFNVSIKIMNSAVSQQVGTRFYASPEIWSNQPYSFDCDIWSFGCVLYELCTLNRPFEGRDSNRIYRKVMMNKYEPIPSHFSYNLMNVIERCLTSADKRINTQDLKRIFEVHYIQQKISFNNIRSCGNLNKLSNRYSVSDLNPEDNEKRLRETTLENNIQPVLDRYLKPERRLTSYRSHMNANSIIQPSRKVTHEKPSSIYQSLTRITEISQISSPLELSQQRYLPAKNYRLSNHYYQ